MVEDVGVSEQPSDKNADRASRCWDIRVEGQYVYCSRPDFNHASIFIDELGEGGKGKVEIHLSLASRQSDLDGLALLYDKR